MKRNKVKENTKETILNMISDHIIWTRICKCMESLINVTSPALQVQSFVPFNEYVGIDNIFFFLKITDKNDPDYQLRNKLQEIYSKVMKDTMNQEETPRNLSPVIYHLWKEQLLEVLSNNKLVSHE